MVRHRVSYYLLAVLAAAGASGLPTAAQQRSTDAPRALTAADYARAEKFMTTTRRRWFYAQACGRRGCPTAVSGTGSRPRAGARHSSSIPERRRRRVAISQRARQGDEEPAGAVLAEAEAVRPAMTSRHPTASDRCSSRTGTCGFATSPRATWQRSERNSRTFMHSRPVCPRSW